MVTGPTPVYDASYVADTVKVTKEIAAAKLDLQREPSYGHALAVQKSTRIRNERVAELRGSLRVVR